jgi:hypothetical protein
MGKIREATEHLGPLYAVELPDACPITVQWWKITSIRQGRADELLEQPDNT